MCDRLGRSFDEIVLLGGDSQARTDDRTWSSSANLRSRLEFLSTPNTKSLTRHPYEDGNYIQPGARMGLSLAAATRPPIAWQPSMRHGCKSMVPVEIMPSAESAAEDNLAQGPDLTLSNTAQEGAGGDVWQTTRPELLQSPPRKFVGDDHA